MAKHYHHHETEITVNEHRAPTDESIRLMEDAHDRAMKNIITKVSVTNNLVNGECFMIDQPWCANDVKMIFKFRINSREFTVERSISRREIGLEAHVEIAELKSRLENKGKEVMLWYALKMLTATLYEEIQGEPFPYDLIKIIK